MKIPGLHFWGVLATAAGALPSSWALHVSNEQPPPAYPIGQVQGANAKVAGRLFDIDGKVEYFAGASSIVAPSFVVSQTHSERQ